MSWRRGDWGETVSGVYASDFRDTGATLPDGTKYFIPLMQTYNSSAGYQFESSGDTFARVRPSAKKLFFSSEMGASVAPLLSYRISFRLVFLGTYRLDGQKYLGLSDLRIRFGVRPSKTKS